MIIRLDCSFLLNSSINSVYQELKQEPAVVVFPVLTPLNPLSNNLFVFSQTRFFSIIWSSVYTYLIVALWFLVEHIFLKSSFLRHWNVNLAKSKHVL